MDTYPLTIEVSDELAGRLRRPPAEIAHILELGLREVDAQRQLQFDGAADVLEFLAGLPAPGEVLALRPSAGLQQRIEELLEKNRAGGLSADEEAEWQQIEYLEHLVRMAKANAQQRLNE
jgi:hypothetical protein